MRKTPVVSGEYYHIYNRGAGKGNIFFVPDHRRLFLHQLKKYCLPEYGEIIAYCLMPNHYHLIIHVISDEFGLKVMLPLTVSYTKLINRKVGRSGHLFQSTYQAKRIESTAQLIHLSRYIHLNPVKAGLVEKAEGWQFSSYREYIGLRKGSLPHPEIVLSDFTGDNEYREYVESMRDEKDLNSILFDET